MKLLNKNSAFAKNIFKMLFLIFALLILSSLSVFAQSNALTIGMGISFPFGYGNGFYYSTVFGRDYDESVFYGIGLNFGISSIDWPNTIDSSTSLYFPLYATIRVRIPMSLPFSIFVAGGMGYSFLFDIVSPLDNASVTGNKTFFYGAFYWQIKVGVGTMLGSRSDGQFEIIFSSPSFNRVTGADSNYPSTDKINMTMISFLFSIRFFQM